MNPRFKLALERFTSALWHLFEQLAGQFLADEFPNLRTLADESGDRGRDAVLYGSQDFPRIALQYSVTSDPARKIRETAKRLNETESGIAELIYVTNQVVPTATKDELRDRLRKHHQLSLDIRDQHWFLERADKSRATSLAAERVCKLLVDPLLSEASVSASAPVSLTDEDSKAALLFLALQREDDTQDRGLTRLCFDGLVRAILRATDNDHRLPRTDVHQAAFKLLPSHEHDEVAMYVNRALERLERQAVRRWTKEDEYCLTYEERSRLSEALAHLELLEREFAEELHEHATFLCEALKTDVPADLDAVALRARRVLELYLFARGEEFVSALAAGQIPMLAEDDLRSLAQSDLSQHADTSSLRHNLVPVVEGTITRLLIDPSPAALHYLHALRDAYTLFAFLRETANVQAAITKVFAGGELYLDTSVILPLMAEELLEPDARSYTRLFDAARSAGVELRTTFGVVEELVSHLARCRTAFRLGSKFRGRTPFLLTAHLWSGRDPNGLRSFLEEFAGEQRPEADLVAFLGEERGIKTVSLIDDLSTAEDELRWQVTEHWRNVHSKRRDTSIADDIIDRLAKHDTESFLGVVQRREGELISNPLGYSTWWLTLDSAAYSAAAQIGERTGVVLDSPVMSLEFLSYYLTVGEARKQLARDKINELPLSLGLGLLDVLPNELMDAAEKIRHDFEGQSNRVIRRKIRDLVESERLRSGTLHRIGIEAIEHDIQMSLQAYSKA
jgi:hypothetical protein